MEIQGNKIIFEGTPIATIDGGWPTLVERFSDFLLDDTDEIADLKNLIDDLQQEVQELKNELDEQK